MNENNSNKVGSLYHLDRILFASLSHRHRNPFHFVAAMIFTFIALLLSGCDFILFTFRSKGTHCFFWSRLKAVNFLVL